MNSSGVSWWRDRVQLLDRLAEIPYRYFRRPTHVEHATWALSADELASFSVTWPTTYQWPGCEVIVETLKDAFVQIGVLRCDATPQTYRGVVMLWCDIDNRRHAVALDYSDYHNFINENAFAACGLYIKCQFRANGYGNPKIVPGGYMVTNRRYYRYYVPYREQGAKARTIEVVGRFGYAFQGAYRQQAVALLSSAFGSDFVGSGGKVRYSRFLRESASAKLSLHMPGNGPFTHRVAEFLGLGTCMVSPRFETSLHVPVVAGVHYVEIADDLSDLIDRAQYYLGHDEEREHIAFAGLNYFDRYLASEQLVRYYVRTIIDRLGALDSQRAS